jgi:hypothetical protein
MNDRGVKLQSVELAYAGAGGADYASGSQSQHSGEPSRRNRRSATRLSGVNAAAYSMSPTLVYESSLASLPDDGYEAMEYTA